MDLNKVSKYISLILRHKPEAAGIVLDEHGWADINDLITGVSQRYPKFNIGYLKTIVETDDKQRYSFNDNGTKIRANQGHSIPVDVELEAVEPPEYLYHGTGQKYVESIDEQGLVPKSRLYVHLSQDEETAVNVGTRHGNPIIYIVQSGQMFRDGYEFFKSVNGVWLIKHVPTKYLKKKNENV